jgi:hypothetical protein
MAIEDYLPNVFGSSAPTYLQGLLGAEETQKLQGRANVQGLLGAGLALAQGMSRTGPRRSAAENILGALAGGFGAAGGAYDQGIKNYVTQQQIAQTQLAQAQAANKLRSIAQAKVQYPDLAPLADIDPGKFAEEVAMRQRMASFGTQKGPETPDSLRAQAQSAYTMGPQFKPFADSLIEKANRLEVEGRLRPQAPTAGVQQPTQEVPAEAAPGSLPGVTVVGQQGPDAQLLSRKNQLLAANQSLATVVSKEARDTIKANSDEIASIDKQLDRFAVSGYDFDTLKKSIPDKFKPQIDAIKNLAQTQALGADQVRIAVQEVFRQAQESERGQRIEGLPGEFAQMRFGTADRTKLTPDQARQVLLFADAPTSDQSAQLQRESIRTQYETGRQPPVPAGRGMFLNAPTQRVAPQPVVSQQVTPQVVAPTPVVPTQTEQVVARTAPQAQVQPQVSPQAAPQPAPARTSTVIDPKVYQNPLISRPDSEVPPKKKQELIQAQPGLIGATNYTIKNIVDARNAAQSLLDNPAYLNALSGRTAPLRTAAPGGIVLDQEAFTANEILNNILGRSFISEIQEMRANSPTGGAVGNVAVAEMESLSKIRGAFKVGMDKAELKKQLESYISNANRAMKTIPNDYARTYGYSGEFDDLLSSEVVSPKPTTQKLPPGVKVRRKE